MGWSLFFWLPAYNQTDLKKTREQKAWFGDFFLNRIQSTFGTGSKWDSMLSCYIPVFYRCTWGWTQNQISKYLCITQNTAMTNPNSFNCWAELMVEFRQTWKNPTKSKQFIKIVALKSFWTQIACKQSFCSNGNMKYPWKYSWLRFCRHVTVNHISLACLPLWTTDYHDDNVRYSE